MSANGAMPIHPISDLNAHPGPMGLTKREAFAMAAMQAIISTGEAGDKADYTGTSEGTWGETVAINAVAYADALLAKLEKEK